jgi:hypothetical protein
MPEIHMNTLPEMRVLRQTMMENADFIFVGSKKEAVVFTSEDEFLLTEDKRK